MFEDDLRLFPKVSDAGSSSIVIDHLNVINNESVSSNKIYIEGWEIPNVDGCRTHIANDHPELATAVYHKAEILKNICAYAGLE